MPAWEHEQANRQGSGSSGNTSWISQETVRNSDGSRRPRNQASPNGRNTEPFPGTLMEKSASAQGNRIDWERSAWSWKSSSPDISPTEERKGSGFSNHRKALAVLGADDAARSYAPSPRPAPIQPSRSIPDDETESIAPWATTAGSEGPGTFFHDYSEHEASPSSATFRPLTGRTFASEPAELDYTPETRRPSTASMTSGGSQGSKSSTSHKPWKKKPKGLPADEYPIPDDIDDSQLNPYSLRGPINHLKARERANSDGSDGSRPTRPRGLENQLPSSDITPWVYQSFNDIPQYGEAPVRNRPIGPDGKRLDIGSGTSTARSGTRDSHRRAANGHRHSRSKEEKTTMAGDLAEYQHRPSTGRDDFSVGLKPLGDNYLSSSTGTLGGRSTSPTPSVQSAIYRESGQSSPGGVPNKRGILHRIRHLKPGSHKPYERSKRDASPNRRRQGSIEGTSTPKYPEPGDQGRKESGKGLGIGARKFGPRRGFSNLAGDPLSSKDGPGGGEDGKHVFKLDTDLGDMHDILRSASPARVKQITDGTTTPREDPNKLDGMQQDSWHAPDSWHVKRPQDLALEAAENPSLSTSGVREREGSFFIRVFRIDSTFATLSANLNATVAEILFMLGRKSFLQDHLNNYEIVLRKNDLSRQLDHKERPILMQKQLLEQIGYTDKDRIEDIGREDHSYLCRFIFLPTKLSGYTSLEADPGFNKMNKFSHVDLQGRSLVTIPITLYKKSSEIISLNLSRNLSLDVPKDFIQSCINLREIKFIGNEASQIPSSFSLASRLTFLDVSNNLLDDLEHAHLDQLKGLVSIKMANNQLTSLPTYFGSFHYLRSLNLSSNGFKVFPEFICELRSLVDLDISFNSIEELPNIGRLTTLERLWMTNNNISGTLDESFQNMVNLKEIDGRFNSISNIDSLSSLPRLEQVLFGHNLISRFRGAFPKLRSFHLDHCPLTQFDIDSSMPTLTSLNLASAKLSQFRDAMFENIPNITKLILDKNHLSSISPQIGKLRRLERLSIIKNPLASLPPTIGCLVELKEFNLRECNLASLPRKFGIHGAPPPQIPGEPTTTPATTPAISGTPTFEDLGPINEPTLRRPSQNSGGAVVAGTPPSTSLRNPSIAPSAGQNRKVSTASRSANTDASSASRKDSNFSQHGASQTFAQSLRNLLLADNRLDDDIFRELARLPELRVVNLSYNELTELPQGLLKRWPLISELYLSGNELTSLPSDDLEEGSNLKVLHINANRFQLCKVSKLSILDVGSNGLKYNVSNWPYDWNWNWNRSLKYLNFSGNKRLEIKPNIASLGPTSTNGTDLTDFASLTHLRVLGLMDVTLTIPTIPEEHEDRRVRTSASLAGSLAYGMADTLGRTEHLSIIDMIVPRLKPDNIETLLKKLQRDQDETPLDALRRTFLALNKNMAGSAYRSIDDRELRQYHRGSSASKQLNQDDILSGGVATVLYLNNMDLYAANVGDAQAILVKSDGSLRYLTQVHDPAEASERARIRAAGGFVSRNGKLNDTLSVSRCFGHFPMMPAVIAAPSTMHTTLSEQDEMIIIASKELWDYVTPELVVDITRAVHPDLMFAAQKLRDLAISFGATNKLMVMILGHVLGPSAFPEEQIMPTKARKKTRDIPGDSRLARFDYVEAPIGELAIIFTDIKKSTGLWETCPDAMRSAIQIHNDILRRQLGIIGGYEVKTEGDAFMVAFATTTAALLWCFNCQTQLLEAEWPTEILEQQQCQVVYDMDNNIIFRGLSVRMGGHWGEPVCEKDPVTNRMDYFGPMVNRASRISAVADGGQIFVSSDFMTDISRNLEVFADTERSASTDSNNSQPRVDSLGHNIRRELQQLNSQGFVIKDQGERKLKGLENPEPLYLTTEPGGTAKVKPGSELELKTDDIWRLWEVTLRLERICGALETPSKPRLREPNVALFHMVKNHGGELNDSTVLSLIDQQVTRIEATVNTLGVRHMLRPFRSGDTLDDHAVPMAEVMQQLQTQLAEYRALKEQMAGAAGIPGGPPPAPYCLPMDHTPSAGSNATPSLSTSSSFLHLDTQKSPPL
ncbi:Ras-association [Penicillium chermesinum]|nr:Ras-association [Penicillium chermesinum]